MASDQASDHCSHPRVFEKCTVCLFSQWFRHPKWAYLATDIRLYDQEYSEEFFKGRTKIGAATNVEKRLNQHKRKKGYHTGAKSTNLHGEFWGVEYVIGPLYEGYKDFKIQWRDSARGLKSRYQQGYKQMLYWNESRLSEYRNSALHAHIKPEEALKQLQEMKTHNPPHESVMKYFEEAERLILTESHELKIYPRNRDFSAWVFNQSGRSEEDECMEDSE